eukprot:1596315-Rhodomonas_salina.1
MSAEEEGTESSRIFLSNLIVYGGASGGLFVVFCLIRNRFPSLYNPRNSPHAEETLRCEIATKKYGVLSWIWGVLKCKEDDIVEQSGLDAACFLRVLRLGLKLSVLGCFNAAWLIPVYRTAEATEDNELVTDWLDQMSVANVNNNDVRLWGTLLSSYMLSTAQEPQQAAPAGPLRSPPAHVLLCESKACRRPKLKLLFFCPQNYAIFLSNIPPALRWEAALERYLHNIFKGDVLQIDLFMHIKELDKDVAARQKLVDKLEHELAKEVKEGGKKKKSSRLALFSNGGSDELRKDIAALTEKINAQIDEIDEQFQEREQRMEQLIGTIEEEDDDVDGATLSPPPQH